MLAPSPEFGGESGRGSKHPRLQRTDLRWLILAGVCWLIVGLSVPFYLVIVYCILGAWGLAAWIKARRFPLALFVRAVIAAAITLPLFAFYTLAFTKNPAFAAWSAQNLLASPSPLQYLLAYLPLGVLAAFGIRGMWRQDDSGSRPALIVGWVLIVPILVYLPINVQRRMSEAVIVPLAVLAVVGLRALAERRCAAHRTRRAGRRHAADEPAAAARRLSGGIKSGATALSSRR